MERAIWSVLVLVWVASLTMLTWQEFTVASVVTVPGTVLVVAAVEARRTMADRRSE